ncbi:MAG: hypothetical protein ABI947_17030 [Chloroflexota bacterium]
MASITRSTFIQSVVVALIGGIALIIVALINAQAQHNGEELNKTQTAFALTQTVFVKASIFPTNSPIPSATNTIPPTTVFVTSTFTPTSFLSISQMALQASQVSFETTGTAFKETQDAPTITPIPSNVPTQIQPNIISPTSSPFIQQASCVGKVVSNGATWLDVIYALPSSNAQKRDPIQPNSIVNILSKQKDTDNSIVWYQISNSQGKILGWIQPQYLIFFGNCSM